MITWREHIKRNEAYTGKVAEICTPLQENLGIAHFTYARIRKDGGFSWISNNATWDTLFFEQKLYLHNSLLADPDCLPEGIVVSETSNEKLKHLDEMGLSEDDLVADQGVAIIHRKGSFVDEYGFSWSSKSGITAASIAIEPGLLNAFIDHFKKSTSAWRYTLLSHPIDLKALKGAAFNLPFSSSERLTAEKRQDFLRGIGIENHYPGLFSLSKREKEVMELFGLNWSYPKIGEALDLSPRTVESYLENVKNKLGVENREELRHAAILMRAANGCNYHLPQ